MSEENTLKIKDYGISATREDLQRCYGAENVFDTDQLKEHFVVEGFCAPYITCVRKSDNKSGTMEFCHNPRLYFNFIEG